jgi:putative oxidoreductase
METLASHLVPPCEQVAQAHRANLAFRVLLSLIFVIAGAGHLVRPAHFVERLMHTPIGQVISGFAPAGFLIVTTGLVLLIAGVALLVGYQTRLAAVSLLAVLVPITVSSHVGTGGDPGPLLKNIALLGALIHFAAVGTASYSIDCWRQRRRARLGLSGP